MNLAMIWDISPIEIIRNIPVQNALNVLCLDFFIHEYKECINKLVTTIVII